MFPGGVTRIPGKGRPTYKIAAFFPTHEDLGPLRDLGLEWQAAFRVAVELVNTGPFKVAFSYVLVDGGEDAKSCRREAEVGDEFIRRKFEFKTFHLVELFSVAHNLKVNTFRIYLTYCKCKLRYANFSRFLAKS